MSWTIPAEFETVENSEVVAFLRRTSPSAHSDVAEELGHAAPSVPYAWFCPDPSESAFVAMHLPDFKIVALALGMNTIAYRLPQKRVSEAVRDGAVAAPEIGAGWVSFDPWKIELSTDKRRQLLSAWCSVAAA